MSEILAVRRWDRDGTENVMGIREALDNLCKRLEMSGEAARGALYRILLHGGVVRTEHASFRFRRF